MNIKITSKDGLTLKTKGKYCKEDISVAVDENLMGGGAKIVTKGGWQGTPVPNEGLVEKIYFNTNLSVDEVVSILENAQVNTGTNAVITYGDNDLTFVETVTNSISTWYIGNFSTLDVYFSSNANGGYADFTGWNTSFTGVVEINSEITQGDVDNSQLSSLFSTTPFIYSEAEEVTLEGEYDGSTVEITELTKGEWSGTTVPNDTYVDTVYLNTSLSVDEVVSNLKQLEMKGDGNISEFLLASEKSVIYVIKQGKNYDKYGLILLDRETTDMTVLFAETSDILEKTFVGWNPNFDGQIKIDDDVLSIDSNKKPIGTQNELLSTLFSIEPFVQSEANVIDLKPYIENKQIPLKFKVNAGATINTGFVGTVVPNEGYVENIYFNTNLSVDEVAYLLSLLTYDSNGESIIFCTSGNGDIQPKAVMVMNLSATLFAICYVDNNIEGDQMQFLYHNIPDEEAISELGFFGWNPNITYPISINLESTNLADDNFIGLENNKISLLFSTTPFEKKEIELVGKYDGTSIEVTENGIIDLEKYIANGDLPLNIKVNLNIDGVTYTRYYFEKQLDSEGNLISFNLQCDEELVNYLKNREFMQSENAVSIRIYCSNTTDGSYTYNTLPLDFCWYSADNSGFDYTFYPMPQMSYVFKLLYSDNVLKFDTLNYADSNAFNEFAPKIMYMYLEIPTE